MDNVIKLSSPETSGFWEIEILHEDADLVALNKPAGLASAPDSQIDQPSLLKLLHAGIAEGRPWAAKRGWSYLMNAHAPEREFSGVFLLARSKPVHVKLAELFGSEKPLLRCVTLVQGRPAEDHFTVDAALAPHPTRASLMHVNRREGKRSRTVFEVLERFSAWALVRCEPLTSRPHQVRVHLKSVNLPVAGDDAYGGRPLLLSRLKQNYHLKPKQVERPLISTPALHAEELTLPHPTTGLPLTITAPRPKDLQVALKYLRRYASGTE